MQRSDHVGDVRLDGDALRLRALEALCDPLTITMLSRVRPARNWHCWEIGAGNGSIARWLAARCASGSVTATDIDTRHLAGPRLPNLLVRRHDVVDGPTLLERPFNLAHTRALLVHLPDRQAVLRRVLDWLTPQGWFVVEEPVLFPAGSGSESCLRRALAGFGRLMADQLGSDFRWPRRLPTALRAAGFVDVHVTTIPIVSNTTGSVSEFWRINLTELAPDLIESGHVDPATLTRALTELADPDHVEDVMAFVCARGRRPATTTNVFPFPANDKE